MLCFLWFLQDLAPVCEGPDSFHLHVLCRKRGLDRLVCSGRQQNSCHDGADDEGLLAGKASSLCPVRGAGGHPTVMGADEVKRLLVPIAVRGI